MAQVFAHMLPPLRPRPAGGKLNPSPLLAPMQFYTPLFGLAALLEAQGWPGSWAWGLKANSGGAVASGTPLIGTHPLQPMSFLRRRRLLRRFFAAMERVASNVGLIREAGKEFRLFSHEVSTRLGSPRQGREAAADWQGPGACCRSRRLAPPGGSRAPLLTLPLPPVDPPGCRR